MSVTVTLNGAMKTWTMQASIQLSNQPITVLRHFEDFNVKLMGYCDQGKSIVVLDYAVSKVKKLYRNYRLLQISSSPQTQITWGDVVWIINR